MRLNRTQQGGNRQWGKKKMVEAVSLNEAVNIDEHIREDFVLEQIFSKLFLYREVEFFDAEPDEEFLKILESSEKMSAEEQRSALSDFTRDLGLGDEFESECVKMGEIVINSDDFEEHRRIPLLVFTLNNGDILAGSAASSFGIASFDVVCSESESFALMLSVRNTADNQMEIYLRLTKQEALNVVGMILRLFEGCTGYTKECNQKCFNVGDEREELQIEQAQADCCSIPACPSLRFHERDTGNADIDVGHQYFN